MQIGLIDTGHWSNDVYKRIALYMYHWSEHHIRFPMAHKSAVVIAHDLKTRMLAYFGTTLLMALCGTVWSNIKLHVMQGMQAE